MQVFRQYPIFVMILLLAGCQQKRPANAETENIRVETSADNPAEMEKSYDEWMREYAGAANDAEAAALLYRAVNEAIAQKDGNTALKNINLLLSRYRNSSDRAEVMFLKGYVLDNILNDRKRALKAYRAFLNEYPTHKLADDAAALINLSGLSDEEIFRRLQTGG